jgi:hypothetical protein
MSAAKHDLVARNESVLADLSASGADIVHLDDATAADDVGKEKVLPGRDPEGACPLPPPLLHHGLRGQRRCRRSRPDGSCWRLVPDVAEDGGHALHIHAYPWRRCQVFRE